MTRPAAVGVGSLEERRRLVAESLRVGNPGNNARQLPAYADPRQDCHIELCVEDIHPYEANPRRLTNAKFPEIKESIRSCGIRNPLTVTRRPGEKHFIVEAGGNTRLRAIQELWVETRESRFEKITALFRPWHSESHVLTAHLIENEQRGEMTFWDKANGVVTLKAQLEAEQERTLSLKQLEAELKSIGMSVNAATLSHYFFATDRLRILGETVAGLSGLDVKTMQPRLNAMKRYAQLRQPIEEGALYQAVFNRVFETLAQRYRQTSVFSAPATCEACEEALADYLHEPVKQVRIALDALVRPPRKTQAELPPHCSKSRTGESGELSPPTHDPLSHNCAADSQGTEIADSQPRNAIAGSADCVTKTISARSLVEEVQYFAGLVGVGECVRPDSEAAYGYAMQALPNPQGDESPQPFRRRAWWLLAVIAGQLGNAPPPPMATSCAADSADAANVGRAGTVPLNAFAGDAALVPWLLDAHNAAAGAFWRILTRVRGLRSSVTHAEVPAMPHPEKTGSD